MYYINAYSDQQLEPLLAQQPDWVTIVSHGMTIRGRFRQNIQRDNYPYFTELWTGTSQLAAGAADCEAWGRKFPGLYKLLLAAANEAACVPA